jgi:MFS family permease
MAFLWTGSQIPVYIFGAIPPYIYADIGGVDRYVHPARVQCVTARETFSTNREKNKRLTYYHSWIWFVLANLLSLAGVCPFVGSLSDLLGRRYVALIGASFVILGMIVCSTAKVMNVFIGQWHSFPEYNGMNL